MNRSKLRDGARRVTSPVRQRLATSRKRVLRGRTTAKSGKESCEA